MNYRQEPRRWVWFRSLAVAMAIALLIAAGCGGESGASQPTTTSTTSSAPTTTAPPPTTSTTSTSTITSSTVPPATESPVVELDGFTTVYSQDGQVRVAGWLDRPAELKVGDTFVEVLDDPDLGISTFDTVLDLEPGEYGIPVTATDSQGLKTEFYLSVLVDPALETQLALIEDVDLLARTVVVDYVEFLTGDEATIAAREDGVIGEDEVTPGGFYLRNSNPELGSLTLGDLKFITVQACYEEPAPCPAAGGVHIDTWIELLEKPDMAEEELGWVWYGAAASPYWLTLQDGMIVQIVEQYLP